MSQIINVSIRLGDADETPVAAVDLGDNPTPSEAKRRIAVALRLIANALDSYRYDRP